MNLFVTTKNFSYHICYENKDKKNSRVKRQSEHGQTDLKNMLVKKSVLNEIDKEGIFTQQRRYIHSTQSFKD